MVLQGNRESRSLDVGEIRAGRILLALRNDKVLIRQRLDDRAHRSAEGGRGPQPSVAIGDLVSARMLGMWPYQDGNLLAALADQCDQVRMVLWGRGQAVADEGRINKRWIKFDHPITSGNHRSGFFGRMSDAAKASPHGADGSRADERSGPKARVSPLP